MALGQERLKVKQRMEVDAWNVKEKLFLAAAVLRSGDQNWMTVSRMLRPFCDPSRPPDWYSQKNCALQYASLLENAETPKRKKRNEKGESQVETQSESIVRKLTQERIEELKRIMQETRTQYMKLKEETAQVRNGYADDRLDEMIQQIDEEKKRKEKMAEAHAQWLKEREKMDADRTWKPPVAIPHRRKINKNVARRNSNQSDPNSEVDSAQDSPLNEPLNVEVTNEDASEVPAEPKPPPQTPTSPLLTSLLKSPSPAPPSQSSILHSAITSHRGSSPTITSLLNSAPGIPVGNAPPTTVSPSLKNLVSSAISGAGTDHPPIPTPSPAAGAPTLSMLLELPPSLPGKPLPELPSTFTPPVSTVSTVPPVMEEICQPHSKELSVPTGAVTAERLETQEMAMARPKEEQVEVLIEEESKEESDENGTTATEPDSKNEEKGAEAEQPIKPTAPSPEKELKLKEAKCEVDVNKEQANEIENVIDDETPDTLINASEKTTTEVSSENTQEEQSTEVVSTTEVDEIKEAEVIQRETEVANRTEDEVPDLENMEVIILGKSQNLEHLQAETVALPEETHFPEQEQAQKESHEESNEPEKEEMAIKEPEETVVRSETTPEEENARLNKNNKIPAETSIQITESNKSDETGKSESTEETGTQKEFKRTLRSFSETKEVDTIKPDISKDRKKDASKVNNKKEKDDVKDGSNTDSSVHENSPSTSLEQNVEAKEPASENIDLKENQKKDENKKESSSKETSSKDNNEKESDKVVSKKDLSPKGSSRRESVKEASKKDDISKEKIKKDVPSNEGEMIGDETDPDKDDVQPSKTTSRKDTNRESQKKNKKSGSNKEDKNKRADARRRDSRSEAHKRNAKEKEEVRDGDDDKKEVPQKQKASPEKEIFKDISKDIPKEVQPPENSEPANEPKKLSPTKETKRKDNSKKELPRKDSKEENKREIMRRSVSKEEKRESPVKDDLKKGGSTKDRVIKDTSKSSAKEITDETKDEERKSKRRPQDETKNVLPDVKKKMRKRKFEDEEKDGDSFSSGNEVKEDQEMEMIKKEENPEDVKSDDSAGSTDDKIEKARSETPSTEDDKTNDAEPPRGAGKKRLGASTPSDSVPNSPAASVTDEEREYRAWKKSIMLVYGRLATHKYASLFLKPITDDQAPGYSSLIHKPIDLLIIKKNIETGLTRTTKDFQRDVMLMFSNSIMYNKSTHFVHSMAQQMQEECLQHIQDFLAAQMLVQTVGETPQRRETRTMEANKHKDILSISSGSVSQDEGENMTGGKRKRSLAPELEKGIKKRKVED